MLESISTKSTVSCPCISPRINWTRSVQDAKKSTGEKIERQGLAGLRFIGKTASEFEGEPWAMYCFFVDHESDGFRSDEHDAYHDLTWKRMSSISGNMWSMYQYVCSIYIWTVWDLFVKELLMILHDHVSYLLIKFSSYSKWNRLNNIWKQLKTYNNYQTAIQQTQRNHQALGCSTGSRWTGLGGAKQTYFFVEGVLSFWNGVFCWGQTYSSIERKCVFSLSLFLLFICSTFTCLGCTLA